jgi:hypothetical protein
VQQAIVRAVLPDRDKGLGVEDQCLRPALPGCWSGERTEEEALENAQQAIRECIAFVEDQLRGEHVRESDVAVRSCRSCEWTSISMHFGHGNKSASVLHDRAREWKRFDV